MALLRNIGILWKLRTLARHPLRTLRVLRDPATPLSSKILPVVAVLYAVMPLDFLPDLFPILGLFDDASVLILLMSYALSRVPDDVYQRAGLDPSRAKVEYRSELP